MDCDDEPAVDQPSTDTEGRYAAAPSAACNSTCVEHTGQRARAGCSVVA